MRLTIWQFLGLVAILVAGYLVYTMWWSKLDKNTIIHDTNQKILEPAGSPTSATSKGGTAKQTDPASPPAKSPW